jgi:hypothetical protein
MNKKKLYTILLAGLITVAILVPVLILMRPGGPTPLSLSILSPTSTTYTSETTQITISLDAQGSDLDTVWYRIYNETDGAWVDPANITWTTSTIRTLGQGGVYTLYTWVNDSTGTTLSVNLSFTMIQFVIIEGDTVFPSAWTIDAYQKYVLRHGDFSFSAGTTIFVDGTLEMENVTWSSTLELYADSVVNAIDTTFDTTFFSHNVIATLTNVTMNGGTELYGNANVSFSNTTFNNGIYANEDSRLDISHSSLNTFYLYDNSVANISYCTSNNGVFIDGSNSIAILRNLTAPSVGVEIYQGMATVINSTFAYAYLPYSFYSGNWVIDQNNISGSGAKLEPKATIIDSIIPDIYTDLWIYGSTSLVINNSTYDWLYSYDTSNVMIYNSTFSDIFFYNDINATIISSTFYGSIYLDNNGTCYLEDVESYSLVHYFRFDQGNITGYNGTFVGAETWSFPKVTIGPNVTYDLYRYAYMVNNAVNFILSNTSHIYQIRAYSESNVSLFFCQIGSSGYVYLYDNSNLTVYYSQMYDLRAYQNTNLTLYNSTYVRVRLYSTSYASIIANSTVSYLYLYDNSDYYKSPDSTIGSIFDGRP